MGKYVFITIMTIPQPRRLQCKTNLKQIIEDIFIQGRGISRERGSAAVEEDIFSQSFKTNRSVNNFYQNGANTNQSGRSSPSTSEGVGSWASYSQNWTGNTTERNSLYSFGGEDSEFDKRATQQVQVLFDNINRSLFEDEVSHQTLSSECAEWGTKFPHFRAIGKQLLPPQDSGYQVVDGSPRPGTATNMLVDVTEQDISATMEVQEITVLGQGVSARVPPYGLHSSLAEESHLENEEIFAQDGTVEDIIAIDYKTDESSEHKRNTSRHGSRTGMPPVTPLACFIDNIHSSIFDFIWVEVIGWLRPITTAYLDFLLPEDLVDYEDDGAKQALSAAIASSFSPTHDMIPSREISLLNSGRINDKTNRAALPSALNRNVAGLDGLLTISTKALQIREKSNLQSEPDSRLESSFGFGPGTSFTHFSSRPLSMRLSSARGRTNVGRARLAPLERAKTPSHISEEDRYHLSQHEVLRGHSLSMTNEMNSPSPLVPFPRNGALPPINIEAQASIEERQAKLGFASRDESSKRRTHLSVRANSAIHDKASIRASSAVHDKVSFTGTHPEPDKDRVFNMVQIDNRPNTTHALYRVHHTADIPLGGKARSSTPMGMSSSRHLHNQTAAAHTISTSPKAKPELNVTGSGINPDAAGASFHVDIHDNENRLEDMIHPQWGVGNTHSGLQRRQRNSYNLGSVR